MSKSTGLFLILISFSLSARGESLKKGLKVSDFLPGERICEEGEEEENS